MPNPQGQIGMKGPFEIPYQEGVFIPVDASGGGLILTDLGCRYYILGNLVFAFCAVTYPVNADANNAGIGGLPLLPAILNSGGGIVYTDLGAFPSVSINVFGTIIFYKPTGVQYTNAEFSGITLVFMMLYIRA